MQGEASTGCGCRSLLPWHGCCAMPDASATQPHPLTPSRGSSRSRAGRRRQHVEGMSMGPCSRGWKAARGPPRSLGRRRLGVQLVRVVKEVTQRSAGTGPPRSWRHPGIALICESQPGCEGRVRMRQDSLESGLHVPIDGTLAGRGECMLSVSSFWALGWR
jgi:hypothetical protein